MYSILADRISGTKHAYKRNVPKGLHAWEVFRMATSGEHIPVDTAIRIRDIYFPGDALEELFSRDNDSPVLTVAEAGHIMQHTMPGEVMPEIASAVWTRINNVVENLPASRGVCYAIGWCLAIGRAAGVREERARRASKEGAA